MEKQINMFEDFEKNIDYSKHILGVDIGGTNTNFGIAGIIDDKIDLLFSISNKTRDITDMNTIFSETINFIKNDYDIHIGSVCIAAAGPVSSDGNLVELTNIKRTVNKEKIEKNNDLEKIFIINDFEAVGYGINLLNHENDIIKIKSKENTFSTNSVKAIIGAGTGLGKSILIYDKAKNIYYPIPSEGGNSDFPAQNDFEIQIINFIKKIRGIDQNITYEELISGRGLENIYSFLRQTQKYESTDFTDEIERATDKAVLISKYKDQDETCNETFKLFTKFYARCAKNFALDILPYDGLYIAGGIAAKNHEIFETDEFIREFKNAYRREEIIKNIPIYVVVNYNVSIYGACFAAYYKNL